MTEGEHHPGTPGFEGCVYLGRYGAPLGPVFRSGIGLRHTIEATSSITDITDIRRI